MVQVGRVHLVKKKSISIKLLPTEKGPTFCGNLDVDKNSNLQQYDQTYASAKLLEEMRLSPKGLPELEKDRLTIAFKIPLQPLDSLKAPVSSASLFLRSQFLSKFSESLGGTCLKEISLKLENCGGYTDTNKCTKFPDISVSLKPIHGKLGVVFHGFINFHTTFFSLTCQSQIVSRKADVSIDFSADTENLPSYKSEALNTALDLLNTMREANKRLLHEQFQTDTIIVGGNGYKIGCHKIYLTNQSPVFEEMFKTRSEDENPNLIQLPQMTECGIKALLNFLYHLVDDPTKTDFKTALELLHACQKYEIKTLKSALIKGLLKKQNKLITVADALKIYIFTKTFVGFEQLQPKAVTVLKMHYDELKQLDEYKNLFHHQPETAMHLCNSLVTTSHDVIHID